jgi:hypothetical protein
MAKEPPVLRFMLSYPINAVDLGPRVAQLAREGITDVRFEVIEDIKTYGKKVQHEVSAIDYLAAWVADHPTFTTSEVGQHFEAGGRSKTGIYAALAGLIDRKVVKKIDAQHYSRADIKHLAPPKKEKAKDPKSHQNRYEVTNTDFILRNARRGHGRIVSSRIKDLFEKDGRNRSSVNPALSDMVEKGLLKRVEEGVYELAEKAKPKVKVNDVKTAVTPAPAAEA